MLLTFLAAATMISSPRHIGPIPSLNGRPRVSPGVVEARAVPPPKCPAKGRGKWIWITGDSLSARFLKQIRCDRIPAHAWIRITADCSYRLYINGQIVARGPADVGRDYDIGPSGPWFYDVVNASKWLTEGDNTIGVEVISRPLVQSEGTLARPGLWLEGDIGELFICSDESWSAAPNNDVVIEPSGPGEPLENKGDFLTLSNRSKGQAWFTGHEANWGKAVLAVGASRPIIQSEIPPPMEAVYPPKGIERAQGDLTAKEGSVLFNGDGSYAVMYDRVISAHIALIVEGGKGGVLTLMPNEWKRSGFHRAVRIKLNGGSQAFEVPLFDSYSLINIEASGVTEPITLHEVRSVFRSYPVEYRGSFECSDSALNETWHVGRWSTQICMQTHHLDSPHHQEPISDPGDYLIESLISYAAFGESGLARQDLRKYAQIIRERKGKVFHTSYALLWLQMLIQYWQHTGDKSLLQELAPTAYELADVWESWRGSNGLISQPPNFMFIDWVEIEGFNLHHPPAVIGQGVLTAFYYKALDDIGMIAEVLGDTKWKAIVPRRRAAVKKAFNRELWSFAKNLYRDGRPGECRSPLGAWLPPDKEIETFSSQVNILACAYGLASPSQRPEIMEIVMASGPANCQPYFMHFAFDALHATGLFNKWAAQQMRRWKVVPDSQTFMEMWDRGDLSHAWQCTPTYQMSSRVLGVTPIEPGFSKILIRPNPCDLQWAKGKVPTPFGVAAVSWERNGGVFKLTASIPKGARALVHLPDASLCEVGPGRHTLVGKDSPP